MSRAAKILWRLFFGGLAFFILLIVAINFGLVGEMPSLKELENPTSAIATEVYASDGSLLGKYYIMNRSNSKHSEISPNVFNALVATEDERFKEHSGIDGKAVMRAVFLLGSKGGGSTITQQLAKNLFPRENANFFTLPVIKLKEWVMAIKLEKNLTKDEIITLYLNTVPFGDNTYGIKNAALTFFNKTPDKLSVDEAAVLVGMLKGNTLYNPRRNPERAQERRNTVMDKMVENNFLSPSEASELKQKPLTLNYKKLDNHEGPAPYFRQVVELEVKKWCKQHEKENGDKYDLYKDGLKIYTTIDPRMQRYAEEAVAQHMKDLQGAFVAQPQIKNGTIWLKGKPKEALKSMIQRSERYLTLKDAGLSEDEIMKNFNTPTRLKVFTWNTKDHSLDTVMSPLDSLKYMRAFLQAGFMAMDPYTGEVKAWVGGIQHTYFQYDHVNISTKRQVGSTIKPLLYCLAVDNGYSPCSSVSTAPQQFAGQAKPYNAGGSKYGAMSMKSALALSVNNASLYLLNQVGINAFIDFAHRCGISSNIEQVPSIALGVSDISLYEMLWAYTMFPNRGINTQPVFIAKIEDKNGNLLQNFVPVQKEIINAQTAYKMVLMMQGVTEIGTAKRLRYRYGLSGDMAGKTGTTNNQADAWFMGYTPQLLAGAWVGCDDRFLRFSSTGQGQGAAAALPIWAYFFKKVLGDKKTGITSDAKFVAPADFNNCGDMGGGGGAYYDDPNAIPSATDSAGNPIKRDDTSEPLEEIPPTEW
ncbi:penicillin-binding protein 1A [Taibaiella chishuiensis]|uniref:Penicillin-binding protein 1A n=1 Tax=Taibaiella chishuiensis TaxID=1434707 RepID=A0A2P8D5I7_9BACT|nr:transglycosylase domain-containing protein [Taibaiella chishuiensis]PSK92459.1 penicillin-binding protein 1A [Taibaiella chishuiensis]